jgi:hypothetical protein
MGSPFKHVFFIRLAFATSAVGVPARRCPPHARKVSDLNLLLSNRALYVEVPRQIEGLFRSLGFHWPDLARANELLWDGVVLGLR